MCPERFQVLDEFDGAAVFDKETGLVWEKTPDTTARNWSGANFHCNREVTVGSRFGWRLPTVEELASLVDRSQSNPTLPAGQPFDVQSRTYWSATTNANNNNSAWRVSFFNGLVTRGNKTSMNVFVWCVRGGQGITNQ